MNNIISIKNVDFKYEDKYIFKKFSLDIEEGTFLSIIGPNGSGKSTLIRIILGLYATNGEISICDIDLNKDNIKNILKQIGVVFENPDDQFVAENVKQDIAFSLENIGVSTRKINKKVKEVAEYLDIIDLLDREPHSLSGGQKQLVSLASALVIEPKILILDEALSMVDNETKNKIYNILKELNKNNKLTIINVTHDSEDILYGNKVLILNNGKNIAYNDTNSILKEEKTFTKNGLKLPFMADLSIKLKYYGLVDDIILDMDKMVDILWK